MPGLRVPVHPREESEIQVTGCDYVALAKAFSSTYRTVIEPEAERVFNRLLAEVSDVLAHDNPRFDREKFATACLTSAGS